MWLVYDVVGLKFWCDGRRRLMVSGARVQFVIVCCDGSLGVSNGLMAEDANSLTTWAETSVDYVLIGPTIVIRED